MYAAESTRDQALIDFAANWTEKLPAESSRIEQARRLPAEISKSFAEGGIYHALVPEEYGGLEVHPATGIDVIKRVAHGDASAGWNVMIGMTTGLLSASMPAAHAEHIYGDKPGVMTVGVTAPYGKAVKVEGGYEVTGRWPFGSGSQNADWICGGSFVFDVEERVMGKHGPSIHLMMFEQSQVEIEDTWHVSGLRGTGSHHYNVNKVFVPEGRSVEMGSRANFQRPLYQFPMLGMLAMGVSAVSLGIAHKALDTFKDLAGVKKPTGSNRTLVNRPLVQAEVARSIADIESAEAYMHHQIREAYKVAVTGERLSTESKAGLRLAAANTTHKCVAAVDRLYQAGGGSSIYEESPLQQCFRDVHVTTQHLMVAAPIYEVVGRVALGLNPESLL